MEDALAQTDNGQQQNQSQDKQGSIPNKEAWLIALIVITTSLFIVAIFGLVAIGVSEKHFEAAEKVLTMILPMIGAWVGSVLAFYFGKENYSAAAASTQQLVRQISSDEKLREIAAESVMLPTKDVTAYVLAAPKTEGDVKIQADLIDVCLVPKNRNRLPILTDAGLVRYVIHRSLIDGFLVKQVLAGKQIKDVTLADMLADPQIGGAIKGGFGTAKPKASLAEVKAQIDGIPDCADVFVTEDGSRNTKVLGWITNVMVTERSRA